MAATGPRFYCPVALRSGAQLSLPAGATRHAQVLRLQPGSAVALFNGGLPSNEGLGGEFEATITQMGRNNVEVHLGVHHAIEREAAMRVHLAVAMPANERMDWLVEKATELGVASIQPLITERSVLRLTGERAEKKCAHWQGIAIAACEQSGRNLVPTVHSVLTFAHWMAQGACPTWPPQIRRLVLSLSNDSVSVARRNLTDDTTGSIGILSGPEGGLGDGEERLAFEAGFAGTSLGSRVLRAETAAVAVLAALTLGTLG